MISVHCLPLCFTTCSSDSLHVPMLHFLLFCFTTCPYAWLPAFLLHYLLCSTALLHAPLCHCLPLCSTACPLCFTTCTPASLTTYSPSLPLPDPCSTICAPVSKKISDSSRGRIGTLRLKCIYCECNVVNTLYYIMIISLCVISQLFLPLTKNISFIKSCMHSMIAQSTDKYFKQQMTYAF
jgi:hypothetical protein